MLHHGATIREILPTIDGSMFDLTLTDPPYGINGGRGGGSIARVAWATFPTSGFLHPR